MAAIYFFTPLPQTCEALKKMYHKLAFKFHPDCGGSLEAMKQINNEYDVLFAKLKNIHVNAEGETYTKDTDEVSDYFKDIISKLINLVGLEIEIIGSFVWVSGDTRPHKDTLKAMAFKWHSKKVCWFLAPPDYRKRSKKQYEMDEIRDMYGSQVVKTATVKALA